MMSANKRKTKISSRFVVWFAVAGAVVGVLGYVNYSGKDVVNWRIDYSQAMAESDAVDRPMLLNFSATWCPPCQMMKRHVFSDEAVAATMERQVVPVYIDLDSNPDASSVANQFQINPIPAFVLVTPDGREISRLEGYHGKAAFLDWLTLANARVATR